MMMIIMTGNNNDDDDDNDDNNRIMYRNAKYSSKYQLSLPCKKKCI